MQVTDLSLDPFVGIDFNVVNESRPGVLESGQRLWCLKLKHYNLNRA